jgi:hypothetical protein
MRLRRNSISAGSEKALRRPILEPVNHALIAALMPSLLDRSGLERRTEVRYPTNDPAQVRLSPGAEPVPGTILDISKSGLRIELTTLVERGTRIEIILTGRAAIFGTVRHCRRMADAYHAGVLVEHVLGVKPDPPQAPFPPLPPI